MSGVKGGKRGQNLSD